MSRTKSHASKEKSLLNLTYIRILSRTNRLQARILAPSAGKRSWSSFMANLNHHVSISTMWRDTKKLTGNGSFRNITQIKSANSYPSAPILISEFLVNQYASISSDFHYDNIFPTNEKYSYSLQFLIRRARLVQSSHIYGKTHDSN